MKEFEMKRNQEQGGVMVFVVLILGVLAGFAALAIDISRARDQDRLINWATDSAALAGVAKLIVPGALDADVTAEARALALANGLNDTELTNGGGIQIGSWNSTTKVFVANGSPKNAVRVGAKRAVPTLLGRLMKQYTVNPRVDSIAMASAGTAACLKPFGIETEMLGNVSLLQSFTIGGKGDAQSAPGNWGKVDIGDDNMSSGPVFEDAMLNGVCGTELHIGDTVSPGTGFAGLRDAFNTLYSLGQTTMFVALVDAFPNGNSGMATIQGFAKILLQGPTTGGGSNWTAQFKLLGLYNSPEEAGTAGTARTLVR